MEMRSALASQEGSASISLRALAVKVLRDDPGLIEGSRFKDRLEDQGYGRFIHFLLP